MNSEKIIKHMCLETHFFVVFSGRMAFTPKTPSSFYIHTMRQNNERSKSHINACKTSGQKALISSPFPPSIYLFGFLHLFVPESSWKLNSFRSKQSKHRSTSLGHILVPANVLAQLKCFYITLKKKKTSFELWYCWTSDGKEVY